MRRTVQLFILASLFLMFACSSDNADRTPKINADVKFTGTQFIITNQDSYSWRNVKMQVNESFELTQPEIKAGETYTVGAMQFAKEDGTRYNPLQMKTMKFSICGETPKGYDCYFGSFK